MEENERSFSFTEHGLNAMLNTVDAQAFQQQDAETIIAALREEMQVVPFCEYLKRYVYLHAGMAGSYRAIPEEEYRDTVCDAFEAAGTPVSLKYPSAKPVAKVGRWLRQGQVRRETVLLLGFGLSMTAEDVNAFLTKALHEHRLDEDDPMEAICLYCYRHQYGFAKMQQLMQVLQECGNGNLRELTERNQPAGREASHRVAEEDEKLIRRILERRKANGAGGRKERTRASFSALYERAEAEIRRRETSPGTDRTGRNGKYSSIEEVLYASTPREGNGNLVPLRNSSLKDVLAGKRLSRQRLSRLMQGEEEPNRYDLINLSFLIFAIAENDADPKERSFRFMEEANRTLTACGFGELYPADPFDCLMLMCMLSVDPLGTCSDVMEMSYEGDQGPKGGAGL